MKNLTIMFLALLGIFTFSRCEKNEMGPVANTTNPGSPSITAPESGQSYTLQQENASDTLLTFEWSESDYGVSTVIDYAVQMDTTQSSDFSEPVQLTSTNQTSYSVTVEQINGLLLGANLPAGQQTNLAFRVVASISDSVQQQVSEPISLGFTPYSLCQFCPEIYVAGNFQAAGGYGSDWTPADGPPLGSISGDDIFEGYVYFNSAGSFKLTGQRGWLPDNWGTPDNSGTLEPLGEGNNINVGQAGYYKIYADIPNLEYSLMRTEWGIIGSATANGWDSDQDMTYDQVNKVWTITTDLASGELKFRANDAWELNYGDNEGDGILEFDAGNIAVSSAGNYTIELDLHGTEYTYTIIEN